MTRRSEILPTTTGGDEPNLALDVYEPDQPDGRSAIFVHGFASRRDGEKARFLGKALAAVGCSMLAPDLQGHGGSGGTFEDLTIERSVRDVLRVARHPIFATATAKTLIGSSFGALVAAWLTVDRPGVCDRLVLIAPAFGFVERHAAALSPEQAEAWRAGTPLSIGNQWIDVRLANHILREAPFRRTSILAEKLDVPTLMIHGRRDEQVPISASLNFLMECRLGSLDLHVIGDGDHRLLAHKQMLAQQILGFTG